MGSDSFTGKINFSNLIILCSFVHIPQFLVVPNYYLEGAGSNPVKARIFLRFFYCNCLNYRTPGRILASLDLQVNEIYIIEKFLLTCTIYAFLIHPWLTYDPYSEECMYGALHLANLNWELF